MHVLTILWYCINVGRLGQNTASVEDHRIHSNLWNVLIIGTPNFNYLIHSSSWNK